MAKNRVLQLTRDKKEVPALPAGHGQAVAQLAYQYFLDRGSEHGYDQEDWLRAEAELKQGGFPPARKKG